MFSSLRLQAVKQALELLFAQVYLVFQLRLLDDEGGLQLQEMLLVGHTLLAEVAGQDVEPDRIPVVLVLLQFLGVLKMQDQGPMLLEQECCGERNKPVEDQS